VAYLCSDYAQYVSGATIRVDGGHVHVQGGLSTGAVHVWATRVSSTSAATDFVHAPDITPAGCSYQLTLQPGWIYTATTTTGQGKGTATAPAAHALAPPYRDNFDNVASGAEARYLSDMQGSFEARPCADGRSRQCVQQVALVKPIEWQDDSDAFSLVGDTTWSDYTVTADVDLQQAGTVELLGRAGTQNRPQSHQAAYELRVGDSGAWPRHRRQRRTGHLALRRTGQPDLAAPVKRR
jgi:glycosyl hydrolase family 59 (putative galactocerebrosidase)